MNPIRQVYEDAPAFIPVPPAYQHHRIEITIWPLEESHQASASRNRRSPPTNLADVTSRAVAPEKTDGLAAAQSDVMQRLWDNEADEIWNHVESL